MGATAARAPEHLAIHVEGPEKARLESTDRRSRRTAVPTAIDEKVAAPVAVQVPDAKIAAEGVPVLGHEVGLGNFDALEKHGPGSRFGIRTQGTVSQEGGQNHAYEKQRNGKTEGWATHHHSPPSETIPTFSAMPQSGEASAEAGAARGWSRARRAS